MLLTGLMVILGVALVVWMVQTLVNPPGLPAPARRHPSGARHAAVGAVSPTHGDPGTSWFAPGDAVDYSPAGAVPDTELDSAAPHPEHGHSAGHGASGGWGGEHTAHDHGSSGDTGTTGDSGHHASHDYGSSSDSGGGGSDFGGHHH